MFFCIFMLQNAKFIIFLGSRYSAGAYLILFVSKFGADSAKRELCRCFLRRVMEVTVGHSNFGPNVVYYFLKNEYGRFNTTTIIIITTPWCPRGVGKDRFQQSDHDTHRDGRKGDPQHKCCGKK